MISALLVLALSQVGAGITIKDEGTAQGPPVTAIDCVGAGITCTRTGPVGKGVGRLSISGGAAGAPTTATYITQTPDATLSAEEAMSLLASGLVLNTTATGVLTIYGGTSCTNQFPRALSVAGAATCASVDLAADVTGTLPQGHGGTGAGALTCLTGQVLTSNGTVYSCAYPGLGVEKSIAVTTLGAYFTATVTGAAWVSATSVITCSVLGTTADGLTPETIALGELTVTVANRVAGTGFDVLVANPNGLEGTVRVHCVGTPS